MLSTLFSGWLTMLEFAAAPQLLPSEGLVILRGQEISEERARAVGKDRAVQAEATGRMGWPYVRLGRAGLRLIDLWQIVTNTCP